jgi:DNA-binding response OmpR family regulator
MTEKKILIIEDDKYVRENICIILEEEGFLVKSAENGIIGIELADHYPFDLILCDVLMPHMDGFEVLSHIRKNKKTSNVPFIFLTAKVENESLSKAFSMGATNYLLKPFQINDLLDSILNILQKNDNKPEC